ncbi:hypothetical protein FRB96_002944 [Tulasnella sp. 330]|nr:hypothetical protein FRB96_002944 [Tulasnella sp. 330]
MTTRLKRKLDHMGIDPGGASNKITESFCLIGSPLPPLEKAKDLGEFQPVWNQEVRDEKGRRRFHGAFTGGFSAGHFNTVGSEEGWTPSTFVSSRNARATKKAARPEDFMDDEDMSEMKDGQRLIDAADPDLLGGTEAEMRRRGATEEDDSLASSIRNLIPATEDSVGAKLLQKMGWRPGQGVGPRVTYAKLKQQDIRATSSIQPSSKPDMIDEEAAKHTFAPRDTQIPSYQAKADFFGLGYSRGPGLQAATTSDSTKSVVSGPNISAGFGLGASNEADEDDLDVYDGGQDRHTGRRLAFEDDDDHDTITLGHSRSAPKPPQPPPQTGPSATFHDGKAVPSGFVVAAKPEVEDTWFELPQIPKGWKPDPTKVWTLTSNTTQRPSWEQENVPPGHKGHGVAGDPSKKEKITADQASAAEIIIYVVISVKAEFSAQQRGSLLGEKQLPAAPKSVFDYLSAKDRERLLAFSKTREAGATAIPPIPPSNIPAGAGVPNATTVAATETPIVIPDLHPSIAKGAMLGFQPFPADAEKQARYDAFLRYHASTSPTTPYLTRRPGQTTEEFKKELSDYTKAAMIFKPATGAMANRFTSAVMMDIAPNAILGLHTPSTQGYLSTDAKAKEEEDAAKKEEETEDDDPKKYAAKMGMYGKLTRETTTWQPSRLLCKRFGVKDPTTIPGAPEPPPFEQGQANPAAFAGSSKSSARGTAALATSVEAITGQKETNIPISEAVTTPGRKDLANIGLGDDETQGRDTLTYERPPMDIFKAIFASDDEDSSDEEADISRGQSSGTKGDAVPVSDTKPSGPSAPKPEAASHPNDHTMKVDEPDSDHAPVNLAKFKPTFVSRGEREGKRDGEVRDKKDKKKKKAVKALVSFDDDNAEDMSSLSIKPKKIGGEKDKEKKKRRRDSEREGHTGDTTSKKVKVKDPGGREENDDDDEMQWVEKGPMVGTAPAGVKPEATASSQIAPIAGRKKAVDFM